MGIEAALAASAAGSLIGGGLQAKASKDAARIQADSADRASQIQADQYYQTRQDQMPWMEAGREALGTLRGMTQPGSEFMRPIDASSVQSEPGYQFGLNEGLKSTGRQLARLQGRNGGATLKALTRFGNDYATSKYDNAYNRQSNERNFKYNTYANLAGVGQQAATNLSGAGANYANNAGNLMTSGAAARGAGLVGAANAYGNAFTNAGNAMTQYQMFSRLFPQDGDLDTMGSSYRALQSAQYPGQ